MYHNYCIISWQIDLSSEFISFRHCVGWTTFWSIFTRNHLCFEVMWGHPKKIILIGEISVGKTSVMRRFVHRTFEGAMKATIGADFMVKEIELGQVRIYSVASGYISNMWYVLYNKWHIICPKSFESVLLKFSVEYCDITNMGHRWWWKISKFRQMVLHQLRSDWSIIPSHKFF